MGKWDEHRSSIELASFDRFRPSGAIVSELFTCIACAHDADSGFAQDAFTGDYDQASHAGIACSSYEIPLPPLNEQKRIADKLDAVLARVDACRERLDRVPVILKRFRQAVLAAATSGKLTEEWREERNKDDSTWKNARLEVWFEGIEAGINVQCEERPPAPMSAGL